jgi:hypothetical protein
MERSSGAERRPAVPFVIGGNDDDGALSGTDELLFSCTKNSIWSSSRSKSLGNSMSALSISSISNTGAVSASKPATTALDDVIADVVDLGVAQLGIAQAGYRIVFIQAVLGLGGGFDRPDNQLASRLAAISSASMVLPVPGSPLTSKGVAG